MAADVHSTDRPYPRFGEPILPQVLRGLVLGGRASTIHIDAPSEMLAPVDLGAGAWMRLSPEACRRLSETIVDRVRTRLAGLPEILRYLVLPHPAHAVTLPLERRTINTLRRAIRDPDDGGPWTLQRYLTIRRFGARALVDLLTGLEAQNAAGAEVGMEWPAAPEAGAGGSALLAHVLMAVSRRLPVSEREINSELITEGHIGSAVDLGQLLRQAVHLGWDAPFRVVRIGGARVVMRLADVGAGRASYRIALRIVQNRGATTIPAVVAQVRATMDSSIDERFVGQLLAGMPTFRWLSQEDGWFWFVRDANPLLAAVRKILSVTKRLALPRLWTALFRARAEPVPSPTVAATIAEAAPEARVVDGHVVSTVALDPNRHLSDREQGVLTLLSGTGRPLSERELRALAREGGLQWPSVWQVLNCSPIVERLPSGLFQPVGQS